MRTSSDPHQRDETITMPHVPYARPTPPVPSARQQQLDWASLSDEERAAVVDFQRGDAPLSLIPTRSVVYLRRHHAWSVRES